MMQHTDTAHSLPMDLQSPMAAADERKEKKGKERKGKERKGKARKERKGTGGKKANIMPFGGLLLIPYQNAQTRADEKKYLRLPEHTEDSLQKRHPRDVSKCACDVQAALLNCTLVLSHQCIFEQAMLWEWLSAHAVHKNDGKQSSIFFCYCFIRDFQNIEKNKNTIEERHSADTPVP